MLKYTLVKNWSSGTWIVNGNTTQLLTSDGSAYYNEDFIDGYPMYNSNTMPRAALIKVSLDINTANTNVGWVDEPLYAGAEGYYSICANDLVVANTGDRCGDLVNGSYGVIGVALQEYEDFGIDTETGARDWSSGYTQGALSDYWFSWGDSWSEVQEDGMSFSNPLKWTEYDAIHGVNGSRVFQLLDWPDTEPWGINVLNENGPMGNVQDLFEDSPNSTTYWHLSSNIAYTINGQWNLDNCMGSEHIQSIMMVDTVGAISGPWFSSTRKGIAGNEVLVFIIFKNDTQLQVEDGLDQTWGIEILGRPQFTHTIMDDTPGGGGGDDPGGSDWTTTVTTGTNEDDLPGGVDPTDDIGTSGTSTSGTTGGSMPVSNNSSGGSSSGSISPNGMGSGMPGPGGMTGSQFRKRVITKTTASFKMEFDQDDDVDIILKTSGRWKIKRDKDKHKNIADGGLDIFKLRGKVTTNKWSKVGLLRAKAPADKYFTSVPYLNSKKDNNVKLRVKTKKAIPNSLNNNVLINEYVFEISFRTDSTTDNTNRIYRLVYDVEAVRRTEEHKGIYRVKFGSDLVQMDGETRDITVYGAPNSIFGIAVNEIFKETEDHTQHSVDRFSQSRETSILKLPNSHAIHTFGKKMPILKAKIGRDGKYTFNQRFPSSIVRKTVSTNTGTLTNQSFIDLASGKLLKAGDSVKCQGIKFTDLTRVTADVALNSDRIGISPNIASLPPKASVSITRERFYAIHIIPPGEGMDQYGNQDTEYADVVSSANIYNRLRQDDRKKLTLSHSITTNTITSNNGVSSGKSAGQTFSVGFSGTSRGSTSVYSESTNKGGSDWNGQQLKKMELLITLADAADRITAVKTPIMNHRNQEKSDWTNSLPLQNGRTMVEISKFTHSALNTGHTITLTWYYRIRSVGFKDVEMTLNLDNILTIQDN